MAQRFFYSGPLPADQVRLSGEELHHLAHVCRFSVGERVVLFNGDGREYVAVIQHLSRETADLVIESVHEVSRELPAQLWVAAPLPKGDRAQFLIEKLTELGTTRFIPLQTHRAIITPGPGRLEKLRRYVIEACKQSGRNRLMEITPPRPLESLLSGSDLPPQRLVADPCGEPLSLEHVAPKQPAAVAVGPEGGFTQSELLRFKQAGWKAVSLGCRVLRIETAAIFIAACFAWRQMGKS